MKKSVKSIVLFALCALLTFGAILPAGAETPDIEVVTLDHAISFTGYELNDAIDGMWVSGFEIPNGGGVELTFDDNGCYAGITGDGQSLKLDGYQSGKNPSYVYNDPTELHNKLIKFRMVFDGSLPSYDGSFIAFALRVPEYSAKYFWDTFCYSFIIKGHRIEVQKHPAKMQGVDNNLGGKKGKTPYIVELPELFTAGTYDVEVGAIDGISPNTGLPSVNLIFRLNGVELVNIWDDSGRTPCVTNMGYFVLAPIHTQEDVQDEAEAALSRSSITILPAAQ